MNGAAEAILEQLLAQARTQTQLLQALVRAFTGTTGGGGGGGGPAGAVNNFATAVNAATAVLRGLFNVLSNFTSGLFKLLGTIIGTVTNAIEALANFGKKAVETGVRLTDFYNALTQAVKGIPILGTIFGFFEKLAQIGETLLDNYRNLARSGATFGGELTDLVKAGARANLTLRELSSIVKQNSDTFATLGAGNVQVGLNKFLDAQTRLMGPDSPYARSILGLGVTSEEAAGFLTTMIRSQSVLGKQNQLTADDLAKQTKDYIVELDTLTRLTGIQREEIDKQIREAQNEQVFQLYLDSLSKDQRKAAQAIINAAAPMGKEAVEEIKARLRGLDIPVTKMGESLTVLGQGAILQGQVLRDAVQKGDANAFNIGLEFLGVTAENAGNLLTSVSNETLAAWQATGQLGLGQIQAFLAMFRRLGEKGIDSALDETRRQQEEALSRSAAAFAENELRVRQLGMGIGALYYGIVGQLLSPLTQFSETMVDLVDAIVGSDGFKEALTNITSWLTSAFQEIHAAFVKGGFKGGMEAFFTKLGDGLRDIWEFVKPPIVRWFENYLTPWFDVLMVELRLGIRDMVDEVVGGMNVKDQEQRRLEADSKILDIKIAALQRRLDEAKTWDERDRLSVEKTNLENQRNAIKEALDSAARSQDNTRIGAAGGNPAAAAMAQYFALRREGQQVSGPIAQMPAPDFATDVARRTTPDFVSPSNPLGIAPSSPFDIHRNPAIDPLDLNKGIRGLTEEVQGLRRDVRSLNPNLM
jgi:hypothetical protein